MDSVSRKARNNSFAHHRASMLFAKDPNGVQQQWTLGARDSVDYADRIAALRKRVMAGILGYSPVTAAGGA